MDTWFITGCSTGLGRALALEVLDRGAAAVVTARDPASVRDLVDRYPDTALAVGLDVTDGRQVTAAVSAAEARFGDIDVLVNNAGYGYRAAIEEGDEAEVAELFATNVFGAVDLIKKVLPGMRARRRGAIVNVSSVAVRDAQPGSGYYAASKIALVGLSDALRKEVGPLGVQVLVVEPGAFRTDFAGRSLKQSALAIDDYAATAGRRRKENLPAMANQPGDPARAARAIMAAVGDPQAPFRLTLGRDAVARTGNDLDNQQKELESWRSVSLGTDLDSEIPQA